MPEVRAVSADLSDLRVRQAVLIRLVREGASITEAAAAIPMHRGTVQHWRDRTPGFAERLDEAKRAGYMQRHADAQVKFLALLDQGVPVTEACKRVGVSTGAMQHWCIVSPWFAAEYDRRLGPTGRVGGHVATLLAALREGATMVDACERAGLNVTTPYKWRHRSPNLWREVQEARGVA